MIDATVTKNNVHIEDSCEISKRLFRRTLLAIENLHPDSDVWKRCMCGMELEISAHNGLYMLGLWKERTCSVDLNYPRKFWEKVLYPIIGCIFWPFID